MKCEFCAVYLRCQHVCELVTAVCNLGYPISCEKMVQLVTACDDTTQFAACLIDSVPRFEGRVNGYNPSCEVGIVYSCKPSFLDHVQERLLQWIHAANSNDTACGSIHTLQVNTCCHIKAEIQNDDCICTDDKL